LPARFAGGNEGGPRATGAILMQGGKDTQRALVRIGYDGRVHKYFKGTNAEERFLNEVRVLKYLEQRECPFVPRVLEIDESKLYMVSSNCGTKVDRCSDEKLVTIFAELERYGVRHDDPFLRNVTYRQSDGRFCAIDFEFATILEPEAKGPPPL
jgi:hypothetical protein